MKTRSVVALVALAISSALPTFAQQTNTPDPQLREQLVALLKKFDDAMDKNDATARGALYTQDAIEVTDQGPIYGREAIEKHYADLFQKVHFINQVSTLDQDSPHPIGTTGNEVWETSAWSATIKGQDFGPIQIKAARWYATAHWDDWRCDLSDAPQELSGLVREIGNDRVLSAYTVHGAVSRTASS